MTTKNKIRTLEELQRIVSVAREEKKRIVTTNGCFDILHVGHVRSLAFAKSQGDILIVGVNSDTSVRALKGESCPIVPQDERAEVLTGFASVDYVFIFDGMPIDWIKKIRPDIQVKSEDVQRHPAFLPEKEEIEKYGGRVVLAPHTKGISSTNLLEKIKQLS